MRDFVCIGEGKITMNQVNKTLKIACSYIILQKTENSDFPFVRGTMLLSDVL